MKLKTFTTELVVAWRGHLMKSRGLSGTVSIVENKEQGFKGENTALRKLQSEFPDYKFAKTDQSHTPADIIGLKKGNDFWHFALYQVKTSIRKSSLTENIDEKRTLPILAKLLKGVYMESKQTNYYKKKPVYITTGYIGLHHSNGRNYLHKKVPYQKDFTMNKLSLTQSEKTEIRNRLHRKA